MVDEKLTEEEHIARAMLMGLLYHHGNGDPFYYEPDHNGQPYISSMLDANTLEPMVIKEEGHVSWLSPKGRRGHRAWQVDNLAKRDARVAAREKDDWL